MYSRFDLACANVPLYLFVFSADGAVYSVLDVDTSCELSVLERTYELRRRACRPITLICNHLADGSSYHFVLTLTSLDDDLEPALDNDNNELVRT